MRNTVITMACFTLLFMAGCAVLKVNYVTKDDVVGEWILSGEAGIDKVFRPTGNLTSFILDKNDSCTFSINNYDFDGTYNLEGNALTIRVKSDWIERYQILSLKEGKMQVSVSKNGSNIIQNSDGYLLWRKVGED
jgi:hypothetical protein